MTIAGNDSADLRRAMVGSLVSGGQLRSPRWIAAFGAVPRETFVDRFVAADPCCVLTDHDLTGADRPAALRAVYTDSSLLTQFDAGGTATSSSTVPSLMASMLEHLDARPGHRVLEVGTGTGYNAALLCHALGAASVTTIDLHPELLDRAAGRLSALGYAPHLAVADGRDGAPRRGPYDRIIATCGFDRVPAAWPGQLAPGGIVVVNVGFGLAVLHAGSHGLIGRFVDRAGFMAARTDATDTAYTARDALALVDAAGTPVRHRASTWPGFADAPAVTLLRSLLLPGVTYVERIGEPGREVVLVDPATQSWVSADVTGRRAELTEAGSRRLWDEFVGLVADWDDRGRPDTLDYGITVRPDGTNVLWLNEPTRIVRVLG